MNPHAVLALLAIVLCAVSCAAQKFSAPTPPPSNYIHLAVKGGWAIDSDIWIYPDDTFTVTRFHSKNRRIDERQAGKSNGLFAAIIRTIDFSHGWAITSESLRKDIEAAKDPETAYGFMDSDHDFLEVRHSGRTLRANFYAASANAKQFPQATEVAAYARLVEQIRSGTVPLP